MMSTVQVFMQIALYGLLGIAVASDLRRHRIPNLLILTGLVLGLVGQFSINGIAGLSDGLLGMLVGFGLFLLLYAGGGMAAGDVKLMAMVGAFLTPQQALISALASLVAGGLCGLALIVWHGQVRQTLERYGVMARMQCYLPPEDGDIAGKPFPYAVAILIGTASGLWFHSNS